MVTPKYLKHLSIKAVMALLSGVGGLCIVFYLYTFTFLYNLGDDKTPVIMGLFIGYPIGASIGIYIAKKLFLKSTRNNIPCLIISLFFAYIAVGGTILSIFLFNIDNNGIELFYLFIVLGFVLLGDSLATKLNDKLTQTR